MPVILVVDDWPEIRGLLTRVFKDPPFEVITAADGQEALEKITAAKKSIALLITDVVMPQMNGVELYLQVKQNHPQLQVLFMTGNHFNYFEKAGLDPSDFLIINKPFDIKGLKKLIETTLKNQS